MRLPNDIIVHYEERADGTGIEEHYAGELIRCRDCMHNGSEDTDCPAHGWGKSDTDFCSWAEREEPNTHER